MKTFVVLIGFLFPAIAYADGLAQVGAGTANAVWAQVCTMLPYCGGGFDGVKVITTIVSNVILWMIGPAAVIIILYASIRLVTSGGNDETVRKSLKEIILYALLGLILAILADTIVKYVYNLIARIAAS